MNRMNCLLIWDGVLFDPLIGENQLACFFFVISKRKTEMRNVLKSVLIRARLPFVGGLRDF